MNLNLFFSALRARFGVFALVLLTTVLAATVVSLLLPKTYRSTASLLVDAYKDEQSLTTVLIPQRERINYIQTQMDIITSKRVAQSGAGSQARGEPDVAGGVRRGDRRRRLDRGLAGGQPAQGAQG